MDVSHLLKLKKVFKIRTKLLIDKYYLRSRPRLLETHRFPL
ncbi:hypothetical protein V512_007275 [Mesotoga sp. Brook.08.105.5.1]|nr:hypothetical protein V512_007275 [Mesotoga sp. Brook.08.105.5.1]RAO96431.1 hypothetical protein M388_14585 [Mesotoga sp. Brook.08.YT.4.2.5.4.]